MRRQYCSGNIAALCVHAELIMITMSNTVYFEEKKKKAEFFCTRGIRWGTSD
jgi:hypothetical protein